MLETRYRAEEWKKKFVIKVSNGYIVAWDYGYYIGHAGKGSALANPFKLADASNSERRDLVIAKYLY